jgi:ArsR family transcriptional regulator
MSQPAISHHLRILREAGVVLDRKEGKWVLYRLNPEIAKEVHSFTESLLNGSKNIARCTPVSAYQQKQDA